MQKPAIIAVIGKWIRGQWRLIATWGATIVGVWLFWPPRPHLTLNTTDIAEIVGVTPDSRSMVALTQRSELDTASFASGPIQVCDLQTGERRIIELPGQKNSDTRDSERDESDGLLDPDSWKLQFPDEPIIGRFCNLIQTNRFGERWAVQLDLDRGVNTKTQLPDLKDSLEWPNSILSRTGRWVADLCPVESQNNRPSYILRVVDTKSGNVTASFRIEHWSQFIFSADETLIAVVEPRPENTTKEETATTTIWSLGPRQELLTIEQNLVNMRFSSSNRRIACYDSSYDIVVIDTHTGETLNRLSSSNGGKTNQLPRGSEPDRFRFSADERRLIGFDGMHGGFSGPGINQCLISEGWIWDLKTDVLMAHLKNKAGDYWEPQLCEDGLNHQIAPTLLSDGQRIFNVETGETILRIPKGTVSAELVQVENGVAVLSRRTEPQFEGFIQLLSRWKIVIPGFLKQNTDFPDIVVVHIPSRLTRMTLPHADYVIEWRSLLLSPDGTKLITKSYDARNQRVVQVWDLSIFRYLVELIIRSLPAPIIILICQYYKKRRFRLRLNGHVEAGHSQI